MAGRRASNRAGFTLPEVMVTVAIVSVLAAIVVPSIANQIGKGDDARVGTTVANVRTAISVFVTDTRRLPSRVTHLFNRIVPEGPIPPKRDLFGTLYGPAIAARWKGPYLSGSLAHNDSLPMSLGFMRDLLIDSSLVGGTGGYVIASLMGVTTQEQAARLDTLIDMGNGNDAGILQWTPAAGAIATGAVKLQIMGSRP